MTKTATFPQPVRAPEIFLTELARLMTILNDPEHTHYGLCHYSLWHYRDVLQEALDKGVYPPSYALGDIVFMLRKARFDLRRENHAPTPEERKIQNLIDTVKLLHEQAEINKPPESVRSKTSTEKVWIFGGLFLLASIILGKTPATPYGFMLLCVNALFLFCITFFINFNATPPEQACNNTKMLSRTKKQKMAIDGIRHEFLRLSHVITTPPYRHVFQHSPLLLDEIRDVTSVAGIPSKELVTAIANTFKTEKFRLRCINQADSPAEFATRDIIFSLKKLWLSINVVCRPPLSVTLHPWIFAATLIIMVLSPLGGYFIHRAILYTITTIPISVTIAYLLGQITRSDIIRAIAVLLLTNASVLFILHHYAL